MFNIKKIHFIGIGGSGMNGIAEVLLNQGYNVSGSDKNRSATTERLEKLGATIYFGHAAENIAGADLVVVSTAITAENPELIAAKNSKLPILPRAQMLAELMRFHHGIAIAGTHGKTTTTSFIASIFAEANLDPTYVIGGLLNSAGANARLGKSKYFIAEADESDASFLRLQPAVAVVTNIDADHMQTYDNDFEKLRQAFLHFLHNLPFYGTAIVCLDHPVISKMLPEIGRPTLTYGFTNGADFQALDFRQEEMYCHFLVKRPGGAKPLAITLHAPGKHNVLNALAAIAVAYQHQIDDASVQQALKQFKGVGRRLQIHGKIKLTDGEALVIDDYGHHPTEIAASIDALRHAWPQKRLVLAFQPHRYSRLQALFDDFAAALSVVDVLILLEVYPAGETPIANIDSRSLARNIRSRGKIDPIFVEKVTELPAALQNILKEDDVLLLQGAGNINSIIKELVKNE